MESNAPVVFVLLREGTSDDGLVPHLRSLLVRSGAGTAVVGSARPYKGSVEQKLRRVGAEGGSLNCVFIHRDADSRSADSRLEEISEGRVASGVKFPCIAVIPIQETEAWLLVDEVAIRRVAGKPGGRAVLALPALRAIENHANPKETLRAALLTASESTGRRREKAKSLFEQHRAQLLASLDVGGPVRELSAWKQLEKDVGTFVADR